jgi:hypothetical protein
LLYIKRNKEKENLGLLALHCFGVAAPTKYFTVFYCGFSALFWAHEVTGFPAASFCFVSPVFPFNLLKARENSMVMVISFTLASGIRP